jgi:hypothetical protein
LKEELCNIGLAVEETARV